MSAGRNALIASGRRLARQLRPATLTHGSATFPCTAGNYDFFERLAAGGAGFQGLNSLFVTLLRSDLPAGQTFKRGEAVTVTDTDSGDQYSLVVGDNNSKNPALLTLNLETHPA